jgi:hypothetical protein
MEKHIKVSEEIQKIFADYKTKTGFSIKGAISLCLNDSQKFKKITEEVEEWRKRQTS